MNQGEGTRWIVARPVAQFALIGVAALVIVGLATSTASRRVGQREAIADARTTTLVLAQGLVEPAVTDALANNDPAAVARIGAVVENQVVDASLVRVKIWRQDGTIVYSNDHALNGKKFELERDELDSLRSGLIVADVSNLDKPENAADRRFKKLLEVYLPVRTATGQRLLFEAYFRYDAVVASGRRIWSSFAPIALGSLLVLELLQIPLAWSLARRLQQRQRERESLLGRALDASAIERRRIANDLHDGVVQDLAGVAFGLAGAARADGVSTKAKGALSDAAQSVRATITALRATLVDISPPSVAEGGLVNALTDLAAGASTSELSVTVDAQPTPVLPDPLGELLFRAARGALRNVTLHAHATTATVRVGGDKSIAWLEVVDDGVGFDPAVLAARQSAGHLGLASLRDVVRDGGGTLTIDSTPEAGTAIRVEIPVK